MEHHRKVDAVTDWPTDLSSVQCGVRGKVAFKKLARGWECQACGYRP